jgi:hypothetical protein
MAVVATRTFAAGRAKPGVNRGPVESDDIEFYGCGKELYVETTSKWKHPTSRCDQVTT